MRPRPRPSFRSAALLPLFWATAPAVALAQEPGPPPIDAPLRATLELEVQSRLRSQVPATRAWGAWLAGSLGVETAAPRLCELLGDCDGHDVEARLLRLHLLDALVRLGVEVPAHEVLPHCEGLGLEPGLVLLARVAGAAERELWDLWRTHGERHGIGLAWIAAGNLLAHGRARGFAAQLWRETPIVLELRVFAPDQELAFAGIGGSFSSSSSDGRLQVPAAFPPTPRYQLTPSAEPGDVLLAPGAAPVHWRRVVRPERELGIGRRNSRPQRERLQLDWLSQMVGHDLPEQGVRLRTSEVLRFVDAATFRTAARAVIAAHRARLDRAARLLRDRGALTEAELAALPSPLRVEVHDLRPEPAAPLPSVEDDDR